MKKKRTGAVADSPDRLNVVVEGSRILGDFIAESNVRIDGEIQGNVSSPSKVVIGKSGFIKGNLVCAEADIEGRLEGHLKIEDLLTLRSNADINGDIETSKIQIEEGAKFSGSCKMSNYVTANQKVVETSKEDVVY